MHLNKFQTNMYFLLARLASASGFLRESRRALPS